MTFRLIFLRFPCVIAFFFLAFTAMGQSSQPVEEQVSEVRTEAVNTPAAVDSAIAPSALEVPGHEMAAPAKSRMMQGMMLLLILVFLLALIILFSIHQRRKFIKLTLTARATLMEQLEFNKLQLARDNLSEEDRARLNKEIDRLSEKLTKL